MKNVLAATLAFLCSIASAHDGLDDTLGFDEKPGARVPLDLTFRGERGEAVGLRQTIAAPTLLMFVYYHCSNACALLPTNLAAALGQVSAQPGRDYQVITVSFDSTETAAQALAKKEIALSILPRGFPQEAWRFLTGDQAEIHELTEAVGFHFERKGDDFDHPLGLVVVSPSGKVVRYMRGADFLAADLRLAMMEASNERVGAAIGKVLRYCLTYDPRANRLALDIVKVGGVLTLSVAAALVIFLAVNGRRRRTKGVQQ